MGTRYTEIKKRDFNDAVKALGLSVYASSDILGISLRQAQRYSSGEQDVPVVVSKLLDMLLRHGIPKAWRDE